MTDFLTRYSTEPLDGKYRLIERLGAGGMGEVFKAEHVFLGATRVIKIVRPQISASAEAHDRFIREARLATKVHHQNVATLHDFASLPDGAAYMVWEFIDGAYSWSTPEDCFCIHFFKCATAILHLSTWDDFQALRFVDGVLSSVRFEVSDNNIDALFLQLLRLFKHSICLSGSSSVTQEHL